ncbi:SHOCT domain-containing protein [Patescibacteria group bacterium]|jgi:putative membrane protein|nr:SHOCT domain-containing protein [Patescibacteria group bacterium]
MYYYGPMNAYHWGWGILMGSVFLIVFIMLLYSVFRLWGHHGPGLASSDDPLEIVKRRYAKGEINKEEYEQLKKDLK